MFLNESDKDKLRSHIKETELRSDGEIVTVIAGQSDGYRYIPLLCSSLAALAVPGIYYLFKIFFHDGWTYPGDDVDSLALVYQIQALVFFALAMLFFFTRLGMWVIPKSVKHSRAARHAAEQFYAQGIHRTDARAGILVFVSVEEHYVEIIVDSAIAERVDNSVWQNSINEFTTRLRGGDIVGGFEATLEKCREVLWEHFPSTDKNSDALPNHLIEL